MWLPAASRHCTEMDSDELEFSSCHICGISTVKKRHFFLPSGNLICAFNATLSPNSLWTTGLVCKMKTRTGRRVRENIYTQGAGPQHPTWRESFGMDSGSQAWAEAISGAAINSRASPAANFSPTPWFNYTLAYNRKLAFSCTQWILSW